VNLQPVHLVAVLVNVIWVTLQAPFGEHQCDMFAILLYVVKLVIKPRIYSPVARQPALQWQPFCAPHSLGVVLTLAPEYEVDVTTQSRVMAHFTCIH